jgi:hypothetical protein
MSGSAFLLSWQGELEGVRGVHRGKGTSDNCSSCCCCFWLKRTCTYKHYKNVTDDNTPHISATAQTIGLNCFILWFPTWALGGPGGSSINVTTLVLSARSRVADQRSRARFTKLLDGLIQTWGCCNKVMKMWQPEYPVFVVLTTHTIVITDYHQNHRYVVASKQP